MMSAELDSLGTNAPGMRICAVCISRNQETWKINDIPFYNYTEGWKPFQHETTRERVAYLAERRNAALVRALTLFPRTEHIMMIDSYYLNQHEPIRGLISEYAKLTLSDFPKGCILGASTWVLDKTRIKSKLRFYDGWTTPEGSKLKLHQVEKTGGILRVGAVGACYLYPRSVWEKTSYDVPKDLHGPEQTWLCEHSGLPVFLSLNQRLWREPVVYMWPKRIRVSLHMGRFLHR